MLTQGWHTGAVFGPSASAAAVCKALRLPVDLIEDALGTACTQACGLMSAQFESMVKRMQHGFAARNGLFAAMMTAGGYTGIKVSVRLFSRVQPANLPYRTYTRGRMEAFWRHLLKDPEESQLIRSTS